MRVKKRIIDGFNWARSRFSDNSAILLYHRVASKERDQFGLCVTPENFEQQMAAVSDLGSALPLKDLIAKNRNGELEPRSLAITFDDGYIDVLQNAVPILERYEIPATIFVVTGNFGVPFWWDRLTDLIIHSADLPETISLGSTEIPTAGQSRNRLLKTVYPIVRAMPPEPRSEKLAELAEVIGHTAELQSERAMGVDELESLARHPLITLGAHTVTHSQLASLSPAEQESEISSSVRQLEEITRQAVETFSYPFGLKTRDYTAETMAAARRAGVDHAIAADLNVVTRRADDFAMPRVWVHDWNGAAFRNSVNRWL